MQRVLVNEGRLHALGRELADGLNLTDTVGDWRLEAEHGPVATAISNSRGERLHLALGGGDRLLKVTAAYGDLGIYQRFATPYPRVTASMRRRAQGIDAVRERLLPSYRLWRQVLLDRQEAARRAVRAQDAPIDLAAGTFRPRRSRRHAA